MFTFFYGKPQAVTSPSLVKEADGSITVQGLLPDGRTVRAFRLTTSELAWLVQSVKTAAPAPAPAKVAKADPVVASAAPVDDLDAALAHLMTLLAGKTPAAHVVRKAAKKGGKV